MCHRIEVYDARDRTTSACHWTTHYWSDHWHWILQHKTKTLLNDSVCPKVHKAAAEEGTSAELTLDDVVEAEEIWIRDALSILRQDQKFPNWKSQFRLYQDECQIWRCGGWLHNADLPYPSKHPVVLPKRHSLLMLVVCSACRRVQHNEVKETITEIWQKFWIIGGEALADH